MKNASLQYKNAMKNQMRDIGYMIVSLGVIVAGAQASATVVTEGTYFSKTKNIFSMNEVSRLYATFEENQCKLDGSMAFAPQPTETDYQYPDDLGYVCNEVNHAIKISFDNVYDLKGFTIDFSVCYPTSFTISNGTKSIEYTNEAQVFTCTDTFLNSSYIIITPKTFINGNKKRLRINSMLMGVGIVFNDEDLSKVEFNDEVSFVSEETPQLTSTFTFYDRYNRFKVDDENSFVNFLETGQTITCSYGQTLSDGSIEWITMPKTYLTQWSQNNMQVTLNGSSIFEFMSETYSAGNTIHERTLYQDAVDVMTAYGLEPDQYYIDESLKEITVTNPLPEVSYAECLQLIANAGRCSLRQAVEGNILLEANFENTVEPTDITVATSTPTYYSNVNNIRTGAQITYADFTQNFTALNDTMYFQPKESQLPSELLTGFISNEVADEDGNFTENPKITLTLPAAFTYFGVCIYFTGNCPEELVITTYNGETEKAKVTISDINNTTIVTYDFFSFDKMEIEITKGCANNRVVISQISFGAITDYRLLEQDLTKTPTATAETKTKSVSVRVFTFTEAEASEDGTESTEGPQQVDDSVYYTTELNPSGTVVTFENQLISTEAHAKEVAEWLGNYYANNITYNVSYRGEPRLDASDIIYMDNDILNNLQVEIEKHKISYNGALSGTLDLRRATNMIVNSEG